MGVDMSSLRTPSRRRFLRMAGAAGMGLATAPAWADQVARFAPPLPGEGAKGQD